MLFSLLDHGTYRRLGETEQNRKANLLLVGATTENIHTSLLKTFMRRIPALISLPALANRSPLERLQFIETFLAQEQKNMGVPLIVACEVLICLLRYDCPENVGQLKSDIQLLCANAFSEGRSAKHGHIFLDEQKLLTHMKYNYKTPHLMASLVAFLENLSSSFVWGEASGLDDCLTVSDEHSISAEYSRIHQNQQDSKEYRHRMDRVFISQLQNGPDKEVSVRVKYVLEPLIAFAQMKFERNLSTETRQYLMQFVEELCASKERFPKLNQQQIADIITTFPKEYKVAKLIQLNLQEELDIQPQPGNIAGLTLLLSGAYEETMAKVGLVIIASGTNLATNILAAAHAVTGLQHGAALDVPIVDVDSEWLERIATLAKQADQGKGVLFLVDLPELLPLVSQIADENGLAYSALCMVSTHLAAMALNKTWNSTMDLNSIENDLRASVRQYFPHSLQTQEVFQKAYILISCNTGQASGKNIEDMLYAVTNLKERKDIEVRHICGQDDQNLLASQQHGAVLAVVGTFDPQYPLVPFVSVDKLVIGDGIRQLEQILGETPHPFRSTVHGIDKTVLTQVFREMLAFLDPEKMAHLVTESLQKCTEQGQLKDDASADQAKALEMRYLIHVACMVERLLIGGEVLPHKNVESMKKRSAQLFYAIADSLHDIEGYFNIKVPDTEIAYIMEIIEGAS